MIAAVDSGVDRHEPEQRGTAIFADRNGAISTADAVGIRIPSLHAPGRPALVLRQRRPEPPFPTSLVVRAR